MYHIFISSSVSGHVSCFHVVTIVNSAAMNIGVCVSFQIMIFSGYMPRIDMAGSYGNSSFFKEPPYYTQLVAVPVYSPTNNVGRFLFLHTLSVTVCRFFDDGHFELCEVIHHCSFFDLHFSNN